MRRRRDPPSSFSIFGDVTGDVPYYYEPRVGDVPCCVSRGMLPPGECPFPTRTLHTHAPAFLWTHHAAFWVSTVHQRLPGSPEGGGFYNRVEFEQALVGYSHGGHLPQRGVSGASDLFFAWLVCLCSPTDQGICAGLSRWGTVPSCVSGGIIKFPQKNSL